MNAYITLDSKKYATLQKDWAPSYDNPRTYRHTDLGVADITFSEGDIFEWEGTVLAKYQNPESGYGTYGDLITSLKKKSSLSFTDHLGTTMNVIAMGPFKARPNIPDWENSTFHVLVRLVKV